MSELIDRQALRAAHGLGMDCADCKQDARSCQYDRDFSRMDFCEWIDDAPTVEPASPWHRVEDGLPNVGELVVGLDADGHAEITMLSESKCWLTYGLWIHNLGCYVWWMPLPEPPKEEEHGN